MVAIIKTLKDMKVDGKRVLVRADFNVPVKNGKITDNSRIIATIPTIHYLIERKCQVILMSHLGRPKELFEKGKTNDEVKKELTLAPIAKELSLLLNKEVCFANNSITFDSLNLSLPNKQIILLENVQFNKGETKNSEEFAKQLASCADIYVNDGFGQSHREYATFCAITKFLPSCMGLLVEKEVTELSKVVNPKKPFIAMIAGAKADKIGSLKALIKKADHILVGGALANTFLKAQGKEIGASKYDEETFAIAKDLLHEAGNKFVLPSDVVVADSFSDAASYKTVSVDRIPEKWMALDIGDVSIKQYISILKNAKTVLWAGPLGVFEMEHFAKSTKEIGAFLGTLDAAKIAGGGDTGAAVAKFHLEKNLTHVSTGGGASLEFIEKEGRLPGIVALEKE